MAASLSGSSIVSSVDESKLIDGSYSVTSLTTDKSDECKYLLLQKAINKTIDKCIGAASFSALARSYPNLCKKNESALKKSHQQFQNQVRETIEAEVAAMFEEANLSEYLKKLDDTAIQADASSAAWRPSGEPENDMIAHLMPLRLKLRDKLQSLQDSMQEEHVQLQRVLQARRKKLNQLHETSSKNCQKLEQAAMAVDRPILEKFEQDVALSNNVKPRT